MLALASSLTPYNGTNDWYPQVADFTNVSDETEIYESKIAACMAHRSQFPKGAESLVWMKEIDRRQGERIDATYAKSFKQIDVW